MTNRCLSENRTRAAKRPFFLLSHTDRASDSSVAPEAAPRFVIPDLEAYVWAVPQFEFCLPTTGKAVPAGPEFFHEVKYDGYRLRIEATATVFASSLAAAMNGQSAIPGS